MGYWGLCREKDAYITGHKSVDGHTSRAVQAYNLGNLFRFLTYSTYLNHPSLVTQSRKEAPYNNLGTPYGVKRCKCERVTVRLLVLVCCRTAFKPASSQRVPSAPCAGYKLQHLPEINEG